jgi:hypothetical protein
MERLGCQTTHTKWKRLRENKFDFIRSLCTSPITRNTSLHKLVICNQNRLCRCSREYHYVKNPRSSRDFG